MGHIDIAFWEERWKAGQIGFHEGRPNGYLTKWIDRLPSESRVLVPLSGKTEDMAFLAARGHDVVGIEAVESAAVAFYAEHGLAPVVDDLGSVRRYRADAGKKKIEILVGDVFQCTPAAVGVVGAFYDRAALVALPDDVRGRYVAHLRGLLAPGATGLVVTFAYDQAKFEGPPFSIDEAEVRRRWASEHVEHLDGGPAVGAPRIRAAGIHVEEHCFLVRLEERA